MLAQKTKLQRQFRRICPIFSPSKSSSISGGTSGLAPREQRRHVVVASSRSRLRRKNRRCHGNRPALFRIRQLFPRPRNARKKQCPRGACRDASLRGVFEKFGEFLKVSVWERRVREGEERRIRATKGWWRFGWFLWVNWKVRLG